jgi:molybdopterin converting factor small subunit
MSQAEFDSSSEVAPIPHQADQTEHEQDRWQQELHSCTQRCDRAYLLLQQTQEKLDLSEQVMKRQEELAQHFQERISQLEQDLKDRCEQLEQSNAKYNYLRAHLKREQKQTSQLKALLERFIDREDKEDAPAAIADIEIAANVTDNWASSLAGTLTVEEHESPSVEITKEIAAEPEIEISIVQVGSADTLDLPFDSEQEESAEPLLPSLQEPAIDVSAYQTPSQISDYATNLIVPQVNTPKFIQVLNTAKKQAEPAPLIDRNKHRAPTSFASVKLPKFPPLQPLQLR